jgi:hypothetical protein
MEVKVGRTDTDPNCTLILSNLCYECLKCRTILPINIYGFTIVNVQLKINTNLNKGLDNLCASRLKGWG